MDGAHLAVLGSAQDYVGVVIAHTALTHWRRPMRTNRQGGQLIPQLLRYLGNGLSIDFQHVGAVVKPKVIFL